jgi:hypothetical protein
MIMQHKKDIWWRALYLTGRGTYSREFPDQRVAMGHRSLKFS